MTFEEINKKHGVMNNNSSKSTTTNKKSAVSTRPTFEEINIKHGVSTNNGGRNIMQSDISRFSPFPQGALTPSGMQSAAVKKFKDNKIEKDKRIKPIIDDTLLSVDIDNTTAEINNLETLKIKAKPILDSYKQKSAGARGDQLQRVNEARDNEIRKITSGYTYDELEALIGEKKSIKNRAEHTQKLKTFLSVADTESLNYDKDFEKYKQSGKDINYQTVGKEYTQDHVNEEGINTGTTYSIDNLRAAAIALAEHNGIPQEQTHSDRYGNVDKYHHFTNDEFDLLAYYLAKDTETGGNQANEFIDLMEETLNVRAGTEIYEEKLQDKTGLEILYGVPVGLDQFASGVSNLFNTEDDYIPMSATQVAGQLAREDLGDEGFQLPKWLGGASIAQVAYDGLSTTANMAPSILASAVANAVLPGSGAYVGGTLMGASAAGNAYQQALNGGMDKTQARVYSTFVGVSEAALSATLSKVMGGKAISSRLQTAIDGIQKGGLRFAANYGLAFVSEGLEEGLQEVLTPLFENIALGYDKNGFEDIDWGEVTYSFLLGGLSGGTFEAAGTGVNRIKKGVQVKQNYGTGEKVLDLLNFGLSLPKDSKVYKLAEKYNAASKTKDKLSSNKVYNLVTVSENYVADTLIQLGETKNVSAVAEAVVKRLTGVELSVAEIELLSKSSYGQETLNTIVPKVESEVTVKDVTEPTLTEAETQLINTPDAELTPEQRIEKQDIEERLQTANNDIQGLGVQQTAEVGSAENSNIEILSVRKKSKQRRHTTAKEQMFIKRIADKLGVKVEFEHITAELLRSYGYEFNEGDILPDGYYDRDTKTVHIGYTVYNPVAFIFKHELTHFGEGTAQYKKFVEAVRNSKAFKNWLNKKIGFDRVENSEEAYLFKIARERGYTLNENGELSEADRQELMCEMIADFVGESIFASDTSMLKKMMSELDEKERNVVIKHIRDFFSYLLRKLQGEKQLTFEIMELEKEFNKVLAEADKTKKETPTESGGGLQFDIAVLENGNTYVKASRKVINGTTLKDQRADITNFFKRLLKNKPSIDIHTIEGDILTITMDDTADKARDNYKLVDGKPVKMSDEEFAVKLRVESHIDEIAETALKENKPLTNDEKNHDFAKDGFEYRTAYFEDFDGAYYKIRFSVGHNGTVATVYNVGKIKEDVPSSAKLIAVVGSQALDGSSSNDIILNNESFVNNNYTQESGNNSKSKLKFSFASVQDAALIEEAEALEKQLQKSNYSPEKIRNEIWLEKGIMRDTGGKWVYEIEDRSMKFFPFGNAKKSNILNDDGSVYKKGKLSDFIKHPKLFKVFPILKSYNFEICDLEKDAKGEFDDKTNTIRISANEVLKANKKLEALGGKMPRSAYDNPYREVNGIIIHEIQHVLQKLEDREPGSSVEYWNLRFERDGSLPVNPKTGEELTPEQAYWLTKGEYEAREAQNRVPISPKYRIPSIPDLGHGKTVSARDTVTAKNLKFSVPSDAEYMSAVETGDTAQLQEMVDNAAASNGYTERLYHQTGAEFTEFNTENQAAGKFDWQLPTGMFLKPSDEDIGLKGKKQMELFAKTDNPLRFKNRSEAQEFWSERIPGYSKSVEKVEKIDAEYREKDNDAIMELQSYMRQWKKENPDADKRDIYSDLKYQQLADRESAIMDEWELKSDKASIEAKKLINDFIANSEYDSIVIDRDDDGKNRRTKSYIVFDSAQLKSAAPVTYDNDGNVIALSKRFNQEKRDIRFSMPSETAELLDMYESGEITKAEYKAAMERYWDDILAQAEDSVWAERISAARYANQLKKRIRRQNEQLARRRSEISKEITAQREERASKQKNIEHIRKTVSRIDKMLRTNSNTKHVPEELKEEIARFISVFVENDRSPFDKKDLRNIQLAYSYALNKAAAMDETNGFNEDILHDIEILREKLEGKTLRDLDLYETLIVRNVVDNLSHIIKQTNEMFIAGKSQQIHEVGHIAMQELTSKDSKKANAVTNALDDTVVYSNMTPIYFFDKIGGVFKTLFGDVVEAQNKWFKNVENGKAFIRQIKEKYNYSEWADDKLEFTTENGDKIKITREQAMLLYATAKREYKNTSQQAKHLFSGGVVIEPSAKKLKDLVNKFKSSSAKGRERIIETFSEEIDARAHKITYKDIVEVGNWLTKEQVAYVNAFVEYLSTDMAVLGNEVSMELYGIRKYNEDYYIPYNSAQNFLYSQPGVTNEARLKHQSFTKNTVYGANNPLILSDFSTVCADHINRMCMYNALTLPLENMNKIFNYGISGEEVSTKNIKSEIERVYGKSAVTYLKTFIEDMNGNVRASQTDKVINRWISLFKKGAVFASASVVVQQPSAIVRAMSYIKPKYFRSTTFKLSERDYQQCVKYASVAGIKEMGRFDTGVGATTTNWLLQETPRGAKNKIKALLSKDSTYRDDKLSYFAAKADEITWAHIWAAVKAEIADTTKLEVGSKEFFETCGKRFTEVINYTQVYDSTISRSQIMRSKSTGAQMLTAFMSEPTVSLNLLMRAATEAKNGTKQGKQFAVNAVAAFVGSVVLNSLLKSLVTAARDDDEDKTYLEKYVGDFIGNFVSDISPLGMIPFVKDIVSIFEGYTVERADMNLFSDLAQSVKTLNSDTKSDYQKFESILGSLAAFLGLPVKNMLRDGRSVYNLYKDFFINDNKTDWQGIKSSVFEHSNSDKYEALVKAAEKDDEKEYQAIYEDLIDSGKDDSKIKSGIKNVYRESGEVQKQTKQHMKSLDGNKTFASFDDEDKQKLESDIMSSLATEKTVKAMVSKPDRFDELYAAYRNNKSNYKRLKQQMLDEGMSASLINDGLEIARIAYMKSVGIDVSEYLLFKIATSKKNADTDNSGGVSKAEKTAAVREMDIDQKIKNYFLNQHK